MNKIYNLYILWFESSRPWSECPFNESALVASRAIFDCTIMSVSLACVKHIAKIMFDIQGLLVGGDIKKIIILQI